MGKGAGAAGETEVTDYRMSLHYGICHGPLDALLGIYVGEKEAWAGTETAETIINVSRPDLFGGLKKEGGVVGLAQYLPGTETQVMPSLLAEKLGRTSANCPAYRGIASVFFYGSSVAATLLNFAYSVAGAGFLWGSNNPYLRDIWCKVRRSPKGLDPEFRLIGNNANPAAIIYECYTNTDWGMGASPDSINTASFEAAAATLLAENFGLFMQWTKQSTIEAFVSEVQDHIQAVVFVNPRDGLITIKLIRNDYDFDDLPILTPDNCTITAFDRKAWGETINEIVVTWTNPENEQEETVSVQNLANIQIQGGIVSDSRNYYGVRTADLGTQLAQRDLASASAPLASFEIEVDRTAWDFVPGGCARLQYPEEGIEDLVIRLGKIDYGKPGQPLVKLNAMEDIFSIPIGAYGTPDDTLWNDPITDPEPMNHVRVLTAPAYFTISRRQTLDYPEVLAAVLGSQSNCDARMYELLGQRTLPNGDVIGEPIGTREVLGFTFLTTGLAAEASTLIATFPSLYGGIGPVLGGFVFIGDTSEAYQEIALLQSFTEGVGWVLERGVLDTVPRQWPSGTPIWFVRDDSIFLDSNTIRSESDIARFKLLPQASAGTLSVNDSPIYGAVLTSRPHRPSRPANVSVGGVAFGSSDLSGGSPTDVAVTWANRNRLTEDGQVLKWSDGTVAAEVGQTTSIKVVKLDGTVLTTHSALSGTSYNVPVASFAGETTADIKVVAVRDGLESLQGHTVRVTVSGAPPSGGDPPGYDPGGGGTGGGGGDPDPGSDWWEPPPRWWDIP